METPFFSIIIPTYNRPERLSKCLETLLQLDYPSDRFEVIVVDDGSVVDLTETVNPFRNLLSLMLLRQSNAGPAAARNLGAQKAKGTFLAFTDDDCMPAPGWLKALENVLVKQPESMVGGATINGILNNPFSTASQLLVDFLYDYYNRKKQQVQFLTSNNFALSADRFRALGGFDVSFPLAAAEDREFCDRWLSQGRPIFYAPEAQIFHYHHLRWVTFWKQHLNYGHGAFRFHRIQAARSQTPLRVEPVTFYFQLLTYPLLHSQHRSLLLVFLLFISQLANVLGFFSEQRKQGTSCVNLPSSSH